MISINEARCNADLVPDWSLQVLSRAVVHPSDPRAGLTHPDTSEAVALMEAIDANVQPIQTPIGELFVSQDEEERRRCVAARDTARQVFALIPVEPQWVGFAETINALADTSESAAEWAAQRTTMRQLADAADLTVETIRETTKKTVPWFVFAVAGLILFKAAQRG